MCRIDISPVATSSQWGVGLERCLGAVTMVNRTDLGAGNVPQCILGNVQAKGSAGTKGMWAAMGRIAQ